MSALVLDAGAFVAIDRGDRMMAARLRAAERSGIELRSNGVVVAQVWREPGGRQVQLARLLRAVDIWPVDVQLGQRAGVLAARAGTSDAIDATVVAIAEAGDRIVTSDPSDLRALVNVSERSVLVVPC
jgi:predicted nucleic acid-binding protein